MRNYLIIIVTFAFLGALMAAINVYRELQRHVGEPQARRAAWRAGLTTFVFLFVLAFAAALLMPYLIREP